jgi:hypothetical protein
VVVPRSTRRSAEGLALDVERLQYVAGLSLFQLNAGFDVEEAVQVLGRQRLQIEQLRELFV